MVRVPDHVVYRDFAEQTVVLNLRTGRYHGLNETSSQMLDALRDDADRGRRRAAPGPDAGRSTSTCCSATCSTCATASSAVA